MNNKTAKLICKVVQADSNPNDSYQIKRKKYQNIKREFKNTIKSKRNIIKFGLKELI